MTTTEINIAIAEACGWVVVVSPTNGNHWWAEHASGQVSEGGVSEDHAKRVCYPSYTSCLNAIHLELHKRETEGSFPFRFVENLKGTILLRAGLKYPGLVGEWRLAVATPGELSEAFLRTIGKWKDASK